MLILMVKKYAILLLGLAVAGAVGPMAYFHYLDHGKTPSQATSAEPQVGVTQAASYLAADAPSEGAAGSEITVSIAGSAAPSVPATRRSNVRVQDASSVFDFQVTPEWIVAHWPAVSTGLAQLQLEGYRVPLVTGTAQHDLAGSLTYYFNPEQKLQQITFIGTTGDPRPLIGLLISRFHLTRRLVNDPGLVVYEAVHYDNRPASSLQIRLAPLAQPNDSYRRYDVELSLQRVTE
ncbi:MAG: DUF6690 family protein [Thermoguttaceae bacterium]